MLTGSSSTSPDTRISRRQFLYTAGGCAGLIIAQRTFAQIATPSFSTNPFTLGVASGDPWPDSVVLWTRLAPDPLAADGRGGMDAVRVPVRWSVASDDRMHNVVRHGTALADPDFGHSVHVEVDRLQSGRTYWYQFFVNDEWSPIGRTRTSVPRALALDRLRIAFASCQHYERGFYTAHRHLATEDLDAVLFLGDYIYEGGVSTSSPRQHDGPEPLTLGEYRNRHALYKTDRDLQAAHAAFPWIVVFDDHEVENNWAGAYDQNGSPPELFLPRRANAFQAFYEHMPLRALSRPSGSSMQLFRSLAFGNLAQFNMLDTRQYRDDQACGDGTDIDCAEALDPDRTLTGVRQQRWLFGQLDRSRARWNVLGQQVFFAQRDFEAGELRRLSMDAWDGYAPTRDRILGHVMARDISNLIVLTGDVHAHYAADLKADFNDPASATIGAEFVGTSISTRGDGMDFPDNGGVLLSENPHIKFVNAQSGYVVCDITHQRWRTEYRVVPFVTAPGAPVSTRAAFEVRAGVPGIEPA
jgi:alkaline phosphatase D